MRHMLVIGASGFIGRHVVKRALEDGWHVTATCRAESALKVTGHHKSGNFGRLNVLNDVDLMNGASIYRAVKTSGLDAIVHCAATNSLNGRVPLPEMVQGDLAGFASLLNAVSLFGKPRLSVLGSALSYGRSDDLHIEAEPLMPDNPYGLVKGMCSSLADYYRSQYNLPIAEFRLFNVYGANDAPKRLIPYTIRSALANAPIHLTSGEQSRDFVHIEDVVKVLLAFSSGNIPSDCYNVATGVATPVISVARMIVELTNSESVIEAGVETERGDAHEKLCGACCKLRRLGFDPKITLSEGLRMTLRDSPLSGALL